MDELLQPIKLSKSTKILKPKVSKQQKLKSNSIIKVEPVLFTPSDEQQLIIDAIKRGENVSVNAVAGSGKTTTILGIANQNPDKKILQITYNRALKLEVEKKAKQHNLTNLKVLTFHGLACSYYDYTAYTDDRIQTILKNKIPLNKPASSITHEIIIIDEIQDMTPLYFELIHKFIYDLQRNVILGIMGDNYQGIYGFKGADERFLTLGERIFINHKPFTKLTLNTSYRLTQSMANFVNYVMVGGHPRIKSIKEGNPVKYIQYPLDKLTDYISNLIINEMKINGYHAEDIFILSGTLRNQRIKDLENVLVAKGILCFVPISEDSKLDERIIKDKIVFTTYHQSKGRERKLVIVFGFDTSYYEMFKDKHSSLLICPNLLYVATTRASDQLIVIEHIDRAQSLPFLKMTHSKIRELHYVNMLRHDSLNNHRNIDSNKPYIKNELPIEHNKSITDMVKFIDESTMAILADLISRVFNITQDIKENNIARIPADIKTGNNTHEQVCDINGVAIPAMLFSGSKEQPNINYLWKYLIRKFCIMSNQGKNHAFIIQYIDKLRGKKRLEGVADWLLLGNIYLCATEGYNYKLKQITEYDWLELEMVHKCHRNIDTVLDRHKITQFEFVLGLDESSQGNKCFIYKTEVYGNLNLSARVDCIDTDTVWELKCVEMLSNEHMLQVVLYSWIWRKINEQSQLEFDNFKAKAKTAISISELAKLQKIKDNLELYEMRKFKLMNIRTGEVRELDITKTALIDEIVKILMDSKLRIREALSDEEFIEQTTARIEKYKLHSGNTFNLQELEAIDEANKTLLEF
jgi:hypothetical protein